jgi:murein DD-endopeptidase MepM/ murein hydrolase activator NlpD
MIRYGREERPPLPPVPSLVVLAEGDTTMGGTRTSNVRRWSASLLLILLMFAQVSAISAGAEEPAAKSRYVLDYPAADTFFLPVRSYAEDVVETAIETDGVLTRHMPNGGYGLPVVMKVEGQNLLHLGADVAWLRPGEPVFAMASGVVRISQGPDNAKKPKQQNPGRGARGASDWGNLIVIEHRLADGSFITSVYGHLSKKRLVQEGTVVRGGQTIGTVGRSGVENGGYKPHLHFGIREGRRFEEGDTLLSIQFQGESLPIRAVKLANAEIEIAADRELPEKVQLAEQQFEIATRDGKHYLPAAVLHKIQNPTFAIIGYGLSLKRWRDPTEFLRDRNASQPPVR